MQFQMRLQFLLLLLGGIRRRFCFVVHAQDECFSTNDELRLAVQDYLSETTSRGRRNTEAARKYGYPMATWCVDRLDDFSYVFMGAEFNGRSESLGSWDTSNAVTMERMFMYSDYDGELADWDTSRVRNMELMFYGAQFFRGTDIDRWDVRSVTDMRWMFAGANSFNQDLCTWGNELPQSAIVNGMFVGTDCEETYGPDLRGNPRGPFCTDCPSLRKCFTSNEELRRAVRQYVQDGSRDSDVARQYGWPSKFLQFLC